MRAVALCIVTEHNLWLVGLAAVVCATAALATFFLYGKIPQAGAARRLRWLGMTGLVAGMGVWATHFLAMLAFETGLPTGYAALETFGSLIAAVASATLGFEISSARRSARNALSGGVVIGAGITAMHYVGMSGYRTAGMLQWDFGYVAASAAIGAVLAGLALLLAQGGSGWRRTASAAGLLALAIAGMHFTGMTAVTVVADMRMATPDELMSDGVMVTLTVAAAALILLTAMGGAALDAASRHGSLRRLREALDVLPEGLAFYDVQDRLVAWNTQYADLCAPCGVVPRQGMPFAELLQTSLVHGCHPDAMGRETEWLAERHALRWGGIPEMIHKTSGGRWLRVTEQRTAEGGTVSVSVDVTELKRAEAAMIKARDEAIELARRADLAEDIARLGRWRLELKSGEISGSTQLYVIFGVRPDQPLTLQSVMAMTHPEDLEHRAGRLQQQMVTGEPIENSVTRIIRPDGEVRILAGDSGVERDADGRIIAVVGILVDITERHHAEEAMVQARAEAEAAAAVKAEFLANMSHELRTPLTSILGFSSIVAAQPELSDRTRGYMARVSDASQALLSTVNDILDFSKLEAGQVKLNPRPTAIADLAQATLDLFMPQAGAKDIGLAMTGGDASLVLLVDPDRIRQILLNLVGNAVKFTDQGEITLHTAFDRNAEVLRVEVSDSGAGIAADRMEGLFKRFSQVDGGLSRMGGTGLGLAICKGLVEAMGGRIGAISAPGEGSRFWFEIPARVVAGSPQMARLLDTQHACDGVRVLVADDHPANRELVRLYLEGVGAQLTEAHDGLEAVRLAAGQPFDVILMDMHMPGLDGAGALRQIRASGPNDVTPVLAFTADINADAGGALTAQGFQGVVIKPASPAVLIEAVVRAAAWPAPQSAEAIHA